MQGTQICGLVLFPLLFYGIFLRLVSNNRLLLDIMGYKYCSTNCLAIVLAEAASEIITAAATTKAITQQLQQQIHLKQQQQ